MKTWRELLIAVGVSLIMIAAIEVAIEILDVVDMMGRGK